MDNYLTEQINSLDNLKQVELEQLIDNSIASIEDGYADITAVYFHLNSLNKMITSKMNILKEQLITEIKKNDKNELYYDNHKFTLTSGGKYDYKHIVSWVSLNKQLKEIEKISQTLYKRNETEFINEETGEVIECAKYKSNKTGVKMTLLKG